MELLEVDGVVEPCVDAAEAVQRGGRRMLQDFSTSSGIAKTCAEVVAVTIVLSLGPSQSLAKL